MDLQLLGPIEARFGDRTVVLGARKQRAVLAMLGLEANRTVSADRLAEGLWGEEPPSSAPKMVQLYVSHLRRTLEGNGARIVTHGRGYEPFAAAEIRRLDQLRLRAAEFAIDADLEAGRHADVIGELERLVAEQPLREHFHVQRMLALYRDGRQSEALAAYQ